MKTKKVRLSVYESNSSSSHSICLDNTSDIMDTSLIPDENGIVILVGGEFGWEWERYNDAITKANYASIEGSGVQRDLLQEVIMEQTGAVDVSFEAGSDWDLPGYSYIDHQSVGTLGQVSTKEALRNFIFNPNCWLITGNDNSSAPANMFDFPKVTKDGIQPVVYTHYLKIENVDDIHKFLSLPLNSNIEEAIEKIMENVKFNVDKSLVPLHDMWSSLKDYYEFSDWKIKGHIETVSFEEGYFIVFSDLKLRNDVDVVIKNEDKNLYDKNLITEKIESDKIDVWARRTKIENKLLKSDIEKYIMKIKFEIIEY